LPDHLLRAATISVPPRRKADVIGTNGVIAPQKSTPVPIPSADTH